MEDFTHQQNDSIPEGLEFNESYMNQAFEMYAAEKESRKRRFYIWFWSVSAGFATVIGFCFFFFYSSENEQAIGSPGQLTSSNNKTTTQHSSSNNKTSIHETDKEQATFDADDAKHTNVSTIVDSQPKSNRKNNRFNKFKKKSGQSYPIDNELFIQRTVKKAGLKPTMNSLKNSVNTIQANRLGNDPLVNADPNDTLNGNPGSPNLHGENVLMQDSSDSTSSRPFDKIQKHHFYMNFGVNTLFGISELKNSFNVRESAGLGYEYRLSQRYFLSLNTEFHSIAKINYYRYIGETTGSLSSTYFTKTTLKYVSISPKIGVNFGRRHSATFGLGLEYLLKDKDDRFEIKGYTENGATKSTNNYYDTFNRLNYSVSLGYGYRLSKNTSIFATYHFGLSDITKNTETTTTLDRNSRLQLLLRIKLF